MGLLDKLLGNEDFKSEAERDGRWKRKQKAKKRFKKPKHKGKKKGLLS